MTEKAPALDVVSEMLAETFPRAKAPTVRRAAAEIVQVGMHRAPTAADAERFRLTFGARLTGQRAQAGAPRARVVAKRTRVTGAARTKLAAELKKKYNNGASIRDLAAETGRSYGFVHRLLTEAGTPLRTRRAGTKAARGREKAVAE